MGATSVYLPTNQDKSCLNRAWQPGHGRRHAPVILCGFLRQLYQSRHTSGLQLQRTGQ